MLAHLNAANLLQRLANTIGKSFAEPIEETQLVLSRSHPFPNRRAN
jgi:hypothetical protein